MKPFGTDLDSDDVVSVPTDLSAKEVLKFVQKHVPDSTIHVTSETMPAFIGMKPGGIDPLTPKVGFELVTVEFDLSVLYLSLRESASLLFMSARDSEPLGELAPVRSRAWQQQNVRMCWSADPLGHKKA